MRLNAFGFIVTMFNKLLLLPIYLYCWLISPLLRARCRFTPTCSTYAIQALKRHGTVYAVWLILRRLSRCHPWGGYGYDPIPQKEPPKWTFPF